MKTVGKYLRIARKAKKLSIKELSEITRIRGGFLAAVEKESWRELPEFPVVSGFVKSMAGALDLDPHQMIALLRRDYPPKKTAPVVTREIKREFRIRPQQAFFLGVAGIILVIAAYLIAQYVSFVRAPQLTVDSPREGQVVLESELSVYGKTDPTTTVIVNTQPALVADDGAFATTIEINEGTTTVEVVATSRAGKETRITRTIKPELDN